MARLRRGTLWTLGLVTGLLLLLVLALLFVTRTRPGVELAGEYVIDRLRGAINGELEVEAVRSRALLRDVTLRGVRITGPDGRLFLEADSARLSYRIRTFLAGDIGFDRLVLYRPAVHVERLPGQEEWNFQTIFPDDPDRVADNIVLIRDVTVRDGFVAIRLPWEPLAGPADTERLILEEVPGGTVRTVRFEQMEARLPRILWQAPEVDGRLLEISRLSGQAYLWTTPADVRQMRGTVTIRDSVVTFRTTEARVADSDLTAFGTMVLGETERIYDIQAQGDQLAFRDFQWLYPALPDEGGGAVRLRIQTRERGNILWLAENARLATPGTELAGSFGIVTGDTLYFTNVSLRASPLDLELVRRLLPMELPVEGLLIGTVEVEGPLSALRTRGDLRYRDLAGPAAESHIRWAGGFRAEPSFSFQRLDAQVRQLELAHVARFAPGLRLHGVATGQVRLNGDMGRGLEVGGHLALDHDELRSMVRGDGSLAIANGRSSVDLRFDAEPVALALLADQYPVLGRIVGEAVGPVRLTGSLDDLRVDADLRTPAGELRLDGRFALTTPLPAFEASGQVDGFRLHRFVDGIPETEVTGSFQIAGDHGRPETLNLRLAMDLTGGRIAGVELQRGVLRVAVADGLARIDSLALSAATATASARGTFGLVAGRSGSLEARFRAESLAPFEPLLRNGENGSDIAYDEARLGGTLSAYGTVSGSLARWDAWAEARARDLVYEGVAVRLAEADIERVGETVAIGLRADSLLAGRRLVPRLRASVRSAGRAGHVIVRADGIEGQRLDLDGDVRWEDGAVTIRLEELGVGTEDAWWQIADVAGARLGRAGLEVDELVMTRSPGDGRVRIAGVLPWRQPDAVITPDAALALDIERLPIGEVMRLTQGDTLLDGVLSARLRLAGTALAPVLDGSLSTATFRYGEAVLDSVGGRIGYRDRLLGGELAGWRDGQVILTANAAIPIELALTRRDDRLLEQDPYVQLHASDLPAGLIAYFLPDLRQVEGVIEGSVALVGLDRHPGGGPPAPRLEGELSLLRGAVLVEPLLVRYRDVSATARMGGGSVVDLDVDLRTDQGSAAVRGTLDLARPRDPGFDLTMAARRLDASGRRDVTAVADAEIRLGGHYRRPVITGNVRLLAGEMNLDEILRQYQIVQLDTTLFQLFDASTLTFRPRTVSPFLDNLVLRGLVVSSDRGFWLRSSELNVEVAGSLDVAFDRQLDDLRLTGTMEALRGGYQLQVLERLPARRFDIRSGTINFPGTPGIDPNLDITALYRVRRAQGDPLDVVATLTGTLQNPRIRLSSDSDPPVSETDIASFLLFGRSALELSQAESDVVASMREGMLGLARPVFLGLAATQLQQAAANLGLPVDYLALSAPEYGFGDYSQVMSVHGGLGVLQGTQLEAGFYAHPDVFVLGTFTPFARGLGTFAQTDALFHPRFGARVEWRFRPAWTWEFYWEDRYARTPSFTYDRIHDRPAVGVTIFRDWGY
jgi:translocation and assembly module TamB